MKPITLLLVDDQDIILDGLQALLGADERFHIVGRATNGNDAITAAGSLRPDVVVLDINMPGLDGIEAARQIRKRNHRQRILVLSMFNNKDFITELLEIGVRGYILKNTGRRELCDALLAVAAGATYLCDPVKELVERKVNCSGGHGQDAGLPTRREKEIIRMILGERTTHQIAEALGLSPQTVETHRKNILSKLRVNSAAGLVKYALERGWRAA